MSERALAHVEKIVDIPPIEGADRVELATVLGWHVMVAKEQFKVGDLAIYIEIDSKVPNKEPFLFLEKKHFAVKTQKYFKGTVLSQGLLMSLSDFGMTEADVEEGQDLTEKLGITYYVPEDNQRKAPSVDKYKKMAQRHQKLFSKKPIRWLMRRTWGKKLLFLFFGRKKDKKNGWPEWVKHTDEIRCQGIPWIVENKDPWISSEKVDGTSGSYTMRRVKKRFRPTQYDYYVCSRNVVQESENSQCYYDTNVYLEISKKYEIEKVLKGILIDHPEWEWVTIQGEIYGDGIQKRDYSLDHHDFAAFNFVTSEDGRWNSVKMKEFLAKYGIPSVPILSTDFILPDTIDELLEIATGKSVIDGKPREGLVFRSQDGKQSFKAVSNEYLLKYH